MIQLIKRPEVNNTDIGLLSRWQSNRQPYIFEFQRQDISITSITNNGGNVVIQVSSTNPIGLDIGFTISLFTDNGVYNGSTGTITGTYGAGLFYFANTNIPFLGNATSGYYNTTRKENYRAMLRLVGYTPTTNTTVELGTLYGTPQANGIVKIDVRTLLTYAMQKQNLFTFNVRNLRDINSYLSFNVYYNALYGNNSRELTNDQLDIDGKTPVTYYAIDGVKNLLQLYGQNFADYLTTPNTPQRNVKFLTEFETPTNFIGFPFSLSWIFNFSSKTNVTLEEDEFNIVGTNTNHYDEVIDKSQNNGVNHLLLTNNYTAGTEYIEAWIEANGTAGEYYVAENYVADFYTDDVINTSGPAIRVTEKKKVFINNDCRKNPVNLIWKNSLGGWDYWLFDNNSEITYTAKHNVDYSVYVENIETANLKSKFVNAEQVKTITVGDSVTISDLYGISGIEKSPQVFMLYDQSKLATNPALAWIGVNVLPKGFKYTALASYIDVEVTFELPDYYTISN